MSQLPSINSMISGPPGSNQQQGNYGPAGSYGPQGQQQGG